MFTMSLFSKKNNNQEESALLIQKHVRGYLTRKKYAIKQLNKQELTSYPVFVVGNDPCMPTSLDKFNESNEKIALIATSGMRAVSLACKLGNSKNTPKIILIDNSKEVYEFWYTMREFLNNPIKASTADLFLKNLPDFLNQHSHLYRDIPADALAKTAQPGVKYLNQNINTYFTALIKKYGYDYVKNVINHTSLIKQSWADTEVFNKIKNILTYHGINSIYAYPSNIVSCIDDRKTQYKVLKNISKINPKLSIHTDCCSVHYHPEKVFLLDNQDPKLAINSIFTPTGCKPTSQYLSIDDISLLLATLNKGQVPHLYFYKK